MRKHLTEEQKQERRKQRAERNKQLEAQGKQIEQIVSDRGEKIAELLKAKRKEKGYTQEEFATLLGISKDSLMDYEKTGELKYPTRVFLSMCEALDCSPQNLMGIDEAHHRETQAIMDVTGLSEAAIETLISCKNFSNGMKEKGHSIRLYDEEVPKFISYILTAMNAYQIFRHIETGAYAKILDKRYEDRHMDYDELKKEIQREEMLHDMLNDDKWDAIDITLLEEENLLFRKAFCENTESAIRIEVHRMLENIYDAFADLRIEEECIRLENGERMV